MPVARCSISISFELEQALGVLALSKRLPKSKVIELLLREHPLVKDTIEDIRVEERVSVFAVRSNRPPNRARAVKAGQRA